LRTYGTLEMNIGHARKISSLWDLILGSQHRSMNAGDVFEEVPSGRCTASQAIRFIVHPASTGF